MRWQRVARYVVAASGLAVAVVIYRETREQPTAVRPTAGTVADPTITVQSKAGVFTRFEQDDKRFDIAYGGQKQLNDGRTIFEKVKATDSDGTVIEADLAEVTGPVASSSEPSKMIFRGHVRLTSTDGAVIESEECTYESATGRATMPGPVTFARGAVSGKGTGGTYERETGVLAIAADASMTMTTEGQPPVTATSASLTFNRATEALLLAGAATITSATSIMSASQATLYLSSANDQFRVVELREQARVTPVPGATGPVPEMSAQDIDLAFHEGTQALERAELRRDASMVVTETTGRQSVAAARIVALTAPDGKTLTKLDAADRVVVRTPARDGAPDRTITSNQLAANGDDKRGLTSALFTGNVVFTEAQPQGRGRGRAGERRATSATLTLALGGKLDAVEEARFQQDVAFDDGDVAGSGDVGIYRANKGQLTLQPGRPGRPAPSIRTSDVHVEAVTRIDVDLATRDVHALGSVKTITAKATTGRGGGALFDGSEPTHGFGSEVWYGGATRRATYHGTPAVRALIRQGERSITARAIEVGPDGTDLTATGNVESVFLLDERSAAGRPSTATKYLVSSDRLEYNDTRRTATFTGTASDLVVLTATNGTTHARRMVMTMAAASRTLDRLEAETDVRLALAQERDGLANSLVYEAGAERYTLRGAVVLRVAGEKPDTCSLSRAQEAVFTRSTRATEFPTRPGGVHTVALEGEPCRAPLTR